MIQAESAAKANNPPLQPQTAEQSKAAHSWQRCACTFSLPRQHCRKQHCFLMGIPHSGQTICCDCDAFSPSVRHLRLRPFDCITFWSAVWTDSSIRPLSPLGKPPLPCPAALQSKTTHQEIEKVEPGFPMDFFGRAVCSQYKHSGGVRESVWAFHYPRW